MLEKSNIGSAGSASANQFEAAKRETHVNGELVNLEQTSNRIEMLLGDLAQRISPILNSRPIDEAKSVNVPQEIIVPLAERIRDTRKRLEIVETHLHMLLGAIEL